MNWILLWFNIPVIDINKIRYRLKRIKRNADGKE